MRSWWLTLPVLMAALTLTAQSSEIQRISLAELETRAEIILLGQVTRVEKEGDRDLVTIKPGPFLKGQGDKNSYTFYLVPRGGLKNFDPALAEGDPGVFFLKSGKGDVSAEKAYWGSVALFPKDSFTGAIK